MVTTYYSTASNARRAARRAKIAIEGVEHTAMGWCVVVARPKVARRSGDGPVARVHAYLDDHGLSAGRKAVIADLVEMGVNYHTARTQVQVWHAANK